MSTSSTGASKSTSSSAPSGSSKASSKSAPRDPLARGLAAAALALALVALVLAGYATWLGQRYLDDVRTMGEALRENAPAPSGLGPPPELAE
ncbi:MAG: hypothetical protein MUE69_01845 [Myxococcota bacterium]|nr:hypothetical protein [Myxococcota bacterium]